MVLQDAINQIKQLINRIDFEKYFNWFILKFQFTDKSKQLNNKKINNLHPIKPRKGDIYLIEFGQNIGNELSNIHMGIIVQDFKNSFSSTIVVVPISSSAKLYDTHERILATDIKTGRLDKLPSKAKAEQIICIDKARLIHKVGEMNNDFMNRLNNRILTNLGIKKE